MRTGDFNGDGYLDLVVVSRGTDKVTILLGAGNGTFTRKGDYEIGNKSTGVVIGDFNRDGKQDLAVPNDGLGNIAILDGNGDGSCKLPRYYYAGPSPQPGVVGDFDKDGKLDLAFPNYFSGEVTIIFGDGLGNFGRNWVVKTAEGIGLEGLAVGDLNGDGNLDLIVTNSTRNIVIPILGNGAGSFTQTPGFGTHNQYLASIQISDFNGDGKPDLAIANTGSGTVSVLLNGCPK